MAVPSLHEIVSALYGTYRLARADKGGLSYFDASVDGFWRSFFAAALIAPFFALLMASRYATGEIQVAPLRFAAIEAISYVIAWVAFPLVMLVLAKTLDRERRVVGYLVAYNWAAVPQNALHMFVSFLALGGILPHDAAGFLSLVILVLVAVYLWFIARVGLDVPAPAAAGIVFMDFAISLFLSMVTEVMYAN